MFQSKFEAMCNLEQILLICTKTKNIRKQRKDKYPCGASKISKSSWNEKHKFILAWNWDVNNIECNLNSI